MQIIEDSIKKAVKDCGQDESLANVLIAWFRELANQSDSAENLSAIERRMLILMEKTKVDLDLID